MNTARLALPLLSVAQAHKELTHNEALMLLDAAVQPVVESNTIAVPPNLLPEDAGKCWIVAASPSGAWSGKADRLACWIGDDWRFIMPADGMQVSIKATGNRLSYFDNQWVNPPVLVDPAGGATIDGETRATLNALLAHLRQIGLVST
jgi:hypothetical protein